MMKKLIALLAFLIVIAACITGLPEKNVDIEARFVEMIIKVQPDVIIMQEGTYRAPLSEIEIKSDELKELNSKFNLISIEKMFARKKPEEEVAKEFPQREERAPEDAEEPDLENTFLFRFPEYTNVETLMEEYETLEEVIYIEENKTVSIF